MIEAECAWCGQVSVMRVVGEPDGFLELVCPRCGESTYERTE